MRFAAAIPAVSYRVRSSLGLDEQMTMTAAQLEDGLSMAKRHPHADVQKKIENFVNRKGYSLPDNL